MVERLRVAGVVADLSAAPACQTVSLSGGSRGLSGLCTANLRQFGPANEGVAERLRVGMVAGA